MSQNLSLHAFLKNLMEGGGLSLSPFHMHSVFHFASLFAFENASLLCFCVYFSTIIYYISSSLKCKIFQMYLLYKRQIQDFSTVGAMLYTFQELRVTLPYALSWKTCACQHVTCEMALRALSHLTCFTLVTCFNSYGQHILMSKKGNISQKTNVYIFGKEVPQLNAPMTSKNILQKGLRVIFFGTVTIFFCISLRTVETTLPTATPVVKVLKWEGEGFKSSF